MRRVDRAEEGDRMRALAPWRGMETLRHEMDRLFDRFFEPRWDEFEAVGEWAPKLDFSETKDAYLVKADFSLSDISSAIEEVLGGRPVTPHASPEPGLEKTSKGYMIYL